MLRGSVNFVANIQGNQLTFPRFDFNAQESSVEKVEIEGPDGGRILITVHLASVASVEDGMEIATKVAISALNRINFHHHVVIENARAIAEDFSRLDPQPGDHVLIAGTGRLSLTGAPATFCVGLSAARLKAELEQAAPPGGHNYGLFRSARQSMSPVEEFMHLYHLLLMLYNDKQPLVDAFVMSEEPSVPRTADPRNRRRMETIYTRLRNEFAHRRAGVNLDDTKREMALRLNGLIKITKRAIELNP
jgi:hypothetical protein